MIQIKPGVSLIGLQPQMSLVFLVADQVFTAYSYPLTITSGTEGKHGKGSLHFIGCALDLRTLKAGVDSGQAHIMASELRRCLGAEFDVVVEDDHLHVEWQPKVGTNLQAPW